MKQNTDHMNHSGGNNAVGKTAKPVRDVQAGKHPQDRGSDNNAFEPKISKTIRNK